MTDRPNLPLAGVTVIDLGQIYQGPYATMLMAKAGADVIKVEPPNGEPIRARTKVGRHAALPLAMLNSNKRAVTLNLKTEQGRALLKRMVARADVLLENFAPGVMDRLGIGWDVLQEVNPRLVYASGTGYGLSGPDRDSLAMDLTVQAASGVMSVTGFPDGPPTKAGPAVVDFLGGIHLYAAVLTALYERHFTGRGRLVEVAMQETVYPTLASNLGFAYKTGGEVPPRTGNRHGGLATAPYNVYPAKDGHVAVICVVEAHWTALLDAMERPELKDDPRFVDNAHRVANMADTDALVQSWTERLTRDEVFATARRHRVPCAPVRNLIEVMNDKHMHGRGMLEWIDHPEVGRIVVPNSPLRFHGADRVATLPSPRLGEHNAEIYGGWLGLTDAEIAALREAGTIT
ncbi:MAG: CoA transferase [Alphaproteobacteria bacterium]|nr:CoA transferase [Alphaproteobacteria bacterium]